MSNYTHFSLLGYQPALHPSLSRGMVNPLGRISPNDIEQEARDEQERRQREDQQRIEEERARRKRTNLSKLREGFSEAFGGNMKSNDEFIDISNTSILDLTQNSVDDLVDTLKQYPKSVVWFFAPWCGHCKTFAQPFLEAEKALRGAVKFIMINGDQNSNVSRAYDIQGFPTLKFFTSGSAESIGIDYDGPRSPSALISFIESQ